jgi:hypothetical protein
MTPSVPPRVRTGRDVAGWAAFLIGLPITAVLALAAGLIILVVVVIAELLRWALWLVLSVFAWVWYGIRRLGDTVYPLRMLPPATLAARSRALNDAYLEALPHLADVLGRFTGFLFTPLALMTSLAGLVVPRWRARPYLAVFTMPDLVSKLIGLGRRRGYLLDGDEPVLADYDHFLRHSFPYIARFLAWWNDPDAPIRYSPGRGAGALPPALPGLGMGPAPDPLGFPGLAVAAMRRRSIRGLRELLLSQREIDDLGDPDLDDREDVAVIRTVCRVDERGIRSWIVQLPSTQSWHPRSGEAPNDITAALLTLAMRETTLTRAALQAMELAGIAPGEPVLLAGFSLGGLVGAQLARLCTERGYDVTHLVTAGAPIGRYDIPRSVAVLSIENLVDPIPRVDGRANPIRSDADGKPWITVTAGPPISPGYRLSLTHQSPSYAETAGLIEREPPDASTDGYLYGVDGAYAFFGPGQVLRDFTATRAGSTIPQADVVFYLHSTVQDGITRGTLRLALRRVAGVIAADVYVSRSGLPTSALWNADVLVRSLRPWFEKVQRAAVYRGLLSLLRRRRAVAIHFRLQAKESPGVRWEATVRRMPDGTWREELDVTFDSDAAEAEWLPLLLPDGWASTINSYPADAFGPLPARHR